MKRSPSLVFRLLIVAFAVAFLSSVTVRLQAQTPPPAPAAKAAPAAEEEDPFAAEPATPLPPGMTGSTTDDPRAEPEARGLRRGRGGNGH